MIKTRIDGMPRQAPEDWDEMKFRQWIGLIRAKGDESTVLPTLFDLPKDYMRGAKIEGLELIYDKLEYLKKVPAIDEIPVKLGDYKFPENVGFETIDQFELVKKKVLQMKDEQDLSVKTEAFAYYCAVYFAQYGKKYDPDEAAKEIPILQEKFMDYPCLEVMAAGSFFQAKCLSIITDFSMTYLRQNTLLKKKRPGLNRLMRRLASMLHLTALLDMLAKLTKKSLGGRLTSSTPS